MKSFFRSDQFNFKPQCKFRGKRGNHERGSRSSEHYRDRRIHH